MLYQLSYALKPHYQVSTFRWRKCIANQQQHKLLHRTYSLKKLHIVRLGLAA
jgi:hypothetical protein